MDVQTALSPGFSPDYLVKMVFFLMIVPSAFGLFFALWCHRAAQMKEGDTGAEQFGELRELVAEHEATLAQLDRSIRENASLREDGEGTKRQLKAALDESEVLRTKLADVEQRAASVARAEFMQLLSEQVESVGEARDAMSEALDGFRRLQDCAEFAFESGRELWQEIQLLLDRLGLQPQVEERTAKDGVLTFDAPVEPDRFFGVQDQTEAKRVDKVMRRVFEPDNVAQLGLPWLTTLCEEFIYVVSQRFDKLPRHSESRN